MNPRPRPNRRLGLIVLGVVVLVIGLSIGYALMSYHRDLTRRSAETGLTDVEATATSWRSGRQRRSGYDHQYTFEVDGRTYEGTAPRRTYRITFDAFKVCYDPDDPADHAVYREDVTCGQP